MSSEYSFFSATSRLYFRFVLAHRDAVNGVKMYGLKLISDSDLRGHGNSVYVNHPKFGYRFLTHNSEQKGRRADLH